MDRTYHFLLLGGDARQAWLAGLLARDGHGVTAVALEKEASAAPGAAFSDGPEGAIDCAVLPAPVCGRDGNLCAPLSDRSLSLEDALALCRGARLVCAGRVSGAAQAAASACGIVLHDLFARPEVIVRNAVPTAEGALALAMQALPVTVHDARVGILGFGRVGQACADAFAALGARVCVYARREEQRALARSRGFDARPFDRPAEHEIVLNTVPAPVWGREVWAALPAGTPVIELASAPGGVDPESARALGPRLLPAPGLPGKVAPASAGAYLRDAIYSLLHEAGI